MDYNTELSYITLVKSNNDSKAFSELCKKYSPIIYKYAKKIDKMHLEDAIQDGRIGLLLACRKFNPALGFKFTTFAYPYIHGYILRGLCDRHSVKIPVNTNYSSLSQDYLKMSNAQSLDNLNLDRLNLPLDVYLDSALTVEEITLKIKSAIDILFPKSEIASSAASFYFGLDDCGKYSITDIANKFNVPRDKIKYIIYTIKNFLQDDEELCELHTAV